VFFYFAQYTSAIYITPDTKTDKTDEPDYHEDYKNHVVAKPC